MLRVLLRNAKPGMTLAMGAQHPKQRSHVLLRTGYELDTPAIDSLSKLGVRFVWVEYPSLDSLRSFVSKEVLESQHTVVDNICNTFTKAQQGSIAKLPYETYHKNIGNLIASLVANPKAALFMEGMLNGGDTDMMRHSSSVTYLSVLMGLKLEGYLVRQRKRLDPSRAKEVTNLGIGAMLHDMGISALEHQVVQRYQETGGDESDPDWQQHPSLGYDMVRGHVGPSAATIVLHHHQRCDGSGYAGKDRPILDGQRIHVFSRIVALAEQFDRILNPINGIKQPEVYALGTLLHEQMAVKFDPQVLQALLAVVPPYPPGSILQLNTGQYAVCIDHHFRDPCRPLVQIIPDPQNLNPDDPSSDETIDLVEYPADCLWVSQCDGEDVTDLNFPTPDLSRPGYVEVALL